MGLTDRPKGNGLKPPIGGAFQFSCGYGIAIDEENSLLFYERGSTEVEDRSPSRVRGNKIQVAGYSSSVGPTPKNTGVIDEVKIPFYVNFAIKTIRNLLNFQNDKGGNSKKV